MNCHISSIFVRMCIKLLILAMKPIQQSKYSMKSYSDTYSQFGTHSYHGHSDRCTFKILRVPSSTQSPKPHVYMQPNLDLIQIEIPNHNLDLHIYTILDQIRIQIRGPM